jgi:hypothetical protein
MHIYLIEKPAGKQSYFSFNRLIKEENLEEMCKKSGDKVPVKNGLPVTICFNQIKISRVEVDERL